MFSYFTGWLSKHLGVETMTSQVVQSHVHGALVGVSGFTVDMTLH